MCVCEGVGCDHVCVRVWGVTMCVCEGVGCDHVCVRV